MNITIIGSGRMGQAVREIAQAENNVLALLSPREKIPEKILAESSVCIEFTHPDVAERVVRQSLEAEVPIVSGTTAWEREEMIALSAERHCGFIYDSNFSLGIQALFLLLEEANHLLRGFDVSITEEHRRGKVDTPSGTARVMQSLLQDSSPSIASVRCGQIAGRHRVQFEGEEETLTLAHSATSPRAFARGALIAAERVCALKGPARFADCIRRAGASL